MYLETVLRDIKQETAPLHSDHVFKLNEALFNLPEEDEVDAKLAAEVFECGEKIRKVYKANLYSEEDHNFPFDYMALLGTMQNQHFFFGNYTDILMQWIKEVADAAVGSAGGKKKQVVKDSGSYEYGTGKGKGKSARSDDHSGPKGGKGKGGKGKSYAGAYDEDAESDEEPQGWSKGKGGKGSAKEHHYGDEGTKKGKAKSKGRGGGGNWGYTQEVQDYEIYSADSWWPQGYSDRGQSYSSKGKFKGRGRGKGK